MGTFEIGEKGGKFSIQGLLKKNLIYHTLFMKHTPPMYTKSFSEFYEFTFNFQSAFICINNIHLIINRCNVYK